MIHERLLVAAKNRTTVAVVNQHLQSHPEEWLAAVNCLGLIDHPNFIKLIGYCTDDDHKLLVYEYMERGSLENYLFRSEFLLISAIRVLGLSGYPTCPRTCDLMQIINEVHTNPIYTFLYVNGYLCVSLKEPSLSARG